MSDTEVHKGRVIAVESKGDLESTAQAIIEEEGLSIDKETCNHDGSAVGEIGESLYGKYLVVGDVIYKYEEDIKMDPYADIAEASANDDGSINFLVSYYNGGCCLNEAVESALKKLGKK
jgi:hypothetical protein